MSVRDLAIGLACLGALVSAPAVAANPVRVALLPIEVHTAEADADYLGEGLVEMIAARLEQSSAISVIRVAGGNGEVGLDLGSALLAGRSAGADYVLFGSFTQFGSGASLDVRCAPVAATDTEIDDRLRQVFIQSGDVGEIIPKLDVLGQKITRYLTDGAQPDAAVADSAPDGDPGEIEELRQRVDALERAVYTGGLDPVAPALEAGEPVENTVAETLDEPGSGALPLR